VVCSSLTSSAPGPPSRTASISRAFCLEHVEVVAEQLDAHVGAHAGDHLVDAHLDRLGEADPHAGQSESSACIASTSSSWVSARVHSSRGLR
jgi:hypothetical protein